MKKAAYLGCVLRTLNSPTRAKDVTMRKAITPSLSFPTGSALTHPLGSRADASTDANVGTDCALGLIGPIADPLTQVLRRGARELLVAAVEAEAAQWIAGHATSLDADGRRQVVRNGHADSRTIITGVGPLEVQMPRVHDRRPPEEKERLPSPILS